LQGPSATFADQKTSQTVRTNAQGEAAARNWMANNQVGTFQVHATATYGNQMGETTFSMSNVTRIVEIKKNRKHQNWWSTRKFKVAVIAGGAAAVAAIVLAKELGSSSKSTSTTTITITPGSPSVGGP
jgi:hypothetical protein